MEKFDPGQASPHASALLVVDVQPDFMPGGALPVGAGDRIVAPVARLMTSGAFAACVATQDWHPAGHVSFASSHPGKKPFDSITLYGHPQTLWPDHCVQGTPGAELHRELPQHMLDAIIRKGSDPECDSYSGFRNNWNAHGKRPATGLGGYLTERGIQRVYVCGLARDVCCAWTAFDALDGGFETFFLWDLTRPVDSGKDGALRDELESRGATLLAVA